LEKKGKKEIIVVGSPRERERERERFLFEKKKCL